MSVLVTVPNEGWLHKHVTSVLLRLQQDRRYPLRVILPTHNPYENNLHHIVNDFMDGDEEWWLSMDSDNPPMYNPLDLIALNKDIIALPTPVWHCLDEDRGERPYYFNGYDYVPEADAYKEHQPCEGLQRVDAFGTGCFLINRRVFEHPEMRKAPFQRQYNEDGTVDKGNDISFSERATSNGFEVWMHYDYPCRHFKEVELIEAIQAFGSIK